jgi:hypothetical protein
MDLERKPRSSGDLIDRIVYILDRPFVLAARLLGKDINDRPIEITGPYRVQVSDGFSGDYFKIKEEFATPEDAVRYAYDRTLNEMGRAGHERVATIYRAYSAGGTYLGGNAWREPDPEEKKK